MGFAKNNIHPSNAKWEDCAIIIKNSFFNKKKHETIATIKTGRRRETMYYYILHFLVS